jgi:hypothetical protein
MTSFGLNPSPARGASRSLHLYFLHKDTGQLKRDSGRILEGQEIMRQESKDSFKTLTDDLTRKLEALQGKNSLVVSAEFVEKMADRFF